MAERRTHGFWKGFLSGLVLAAAGLLAVAWLHPPAPLPTPAAEAPAPSAGDAPADAAPAPETVPASPSLVPQP